MFNLILYQCTILTGLLEQKYPLLCYHKLDLTVTTSGNPRTTPTALDSPEIGEMRRGVTIAVALVLVIGTLLSVLLFQVTQPGSTIFGQTVITETVTMPNITYNESQPQQVILENYDWTTLSMPILTLRNAGPTQVIFGDWFINGARQTPTGPCIMNPLPPGSTCTATLALPVYVTTTVPYTIKVVAVDGQIFSYCIRAGDSGTGLSTTDCTQPKIIMEAYNWGTATSLVLTLRNVGPVNVQIQDYFVNGALVPTVTGSCGYSGEANYQLSVGSSCAEILTPVSVTISVGVGYVIKIVAVDGSVFSFTAIAGSAA